MLSLTIAAHRAFWRQRETTMRQAVAAYINEELHRPSHSLSARRINPVKMTPPATVCRAPAPIVPSSSLHKTPLFCSEEVEVLKLTPRPIVNMSGWTLYLDSEGAVDEGAGPTLNASEELFLLVEADEIADVNAFISGHQQWWRTGVDAVKLESLCRRVAWRVGPPFSVVLACSRSDLEQLIDAYLSDLLVTDDPLVINAITVINAVGRPVDLIRTDSTASIPSPDPQNKTRRDPPFRTPPNVVVFDASDEESALVQEVVKSLGRSLGADSYALHRLSDADWTSGVWRSCTALLVCLCDRVENQRTLTTIREKVTEFAKSFRGAALLLLPANEELSESEMEDVEEGWTQVELGDAALGRLLCLRDITHLTTVSRLKALLRLLNVECSQEEEEEESKRDADKETPMFVCTGRDAATAHVNRILDAMSPLGFQMQSGDTKLTDGKSRLLIRWSQSEQVHAELKPDFRFDQFFTNEREFRKPAVLLHSDVTTSSWTMMSEIFGRLPSNSGLVISSKQQTAGTGRGRNSWISPLGQLQMTYHCSTKVSSPIGQCPSLLQHLAALTIVQSIEEETRSVLAGKDLGIRLKWPNDILLVRGGVSQKIGGVLTKASFKDSNIEFIVGAGLNVANRKPTTCLHDALLSVNVKEDSLPSIEVLMRRVIILMQTNLMKLESGALSLDELRRRYESRWVHNEQVVSVTQTDGTTLSGCRIIGIDHYGFLLVKSPLGEVCSIHPDGNSFDLLQNLIRPKRW